jgi:hypothetical protein
MTDDEQQKYHHDANEGETRGPASDRAEPHHALNTPVEAVDEGDPATANDPETLGDSDMDR